MATHHPHNGSRSQALYQRALKVLPGGVSRNTVLRRPHPQYVDFAAGCRTTDVDGVVRLDFANNMASLIHGHAHPAVVSAVAEQLAKGTAYAVRRRSRFATPRPCVHVIQASRDSASSTPVRRL